MKSPRAASRRPARTGAASASAGASAARAARPPAAAPRARRPATRSPAASRAARCRCKQRVPKLQGLQQPVPGRVPGHQPRRASRRPASTEVDPERRSTATASPTRARSSRCSAGARSPARVTVKAHGFSKAAEAAITAAGGTRGGPAAAVRATAVRRPRATSSPTADRAPGRTAAPGATPVLASLKNIFKVPDLRNKILFTLLMIVLYRLGRPHPGARRRPRRGQAAAERRPRRSGVLGFLNLFSGGALTPVRRLRARDHAVHHGVDHHADPRRGDPQARGVAEPGRGRPAQDHPVDALPDHRASRCCRPPASRSCSHNGGGRRSSAAAPRTSILLPDFTLARVLLVVLTLTAGTALLMWIGELITQRGIGNGMSMLIFASVVSTPAVPVLRPSKAEGGTSSSAPRGARRIVILVAIVFVEQGQRRIPVQFAKRVVGRRMYGGQSTYIPLKVNQAGVIPIIFASSVLYLPALLSNVLPCRRLGRSDAELRQQLPGQRRTRRPPRSSTAC